MASFDKAYHPSLQGYRDKVFDDLTSLKEQVQERKIALSVLKEMTEEEFAGSPLAMETWFGTNGARYEGTDI